MKSFDAPIKYCKKKESYYSEPFDLELKYFLKTIVDDETREIFGGLYFRASLLHGSIVNLHCINKVVYLQIIRSFRTIIIKYIFTQWCVGSAQYL